MGDFIWQCGARQICTMSERISANACNAVGDNYACQFSAEGKCAVSNIRNTIGKGYAYKVLTVAKCIIFNDCNAVRDNYACKFLAVKCLFTYCSYPISVNIFGNF